MTPSLGFEEVIAMYKQSDFSRLLEKIEKIKFEDREYFHHKYQLICLNRLSEYEKLEDGFHKILGEINIDNPLERIEIYSEYLRLKFRLGRYMEGIELFEEVSKFLEDLDNMELNDKEKRILAAHYNHGGIFYTFVGDFDKAMIYYDDILEIGNDLNNDDIKSTVLNNAGLIQLRIGNIVQAEKIIKEALELADKTDYPGRNLMPMMNLGKLYTNQGRINEALVILKKCLKDASQHSDKYNIAMVYQTMGEAYFKTGKFEETIENLNQALRIGKEINNDFILLRVKIILFQTYVTFKDREMSHKILREVEEITTRINLPHYDLKYKLANAMYLKTSSLYRNKQKAENDLRDLIHCKLEFQDRLIAFINLVDLLTEQINGMNDYEQLGSEEEQEIKYEIENLLQQFLANVNLEQDPFLKIQVNYIQAYLSIIDMNIEKAQKHIDLAIELCQTHNLRFGNLTKPKLDEFLKATNTTFCKTISTSINSIVHSEPRLKILIALNMYPKLTFAELKEIVGLTSGNLGGNCDKLADAEYIYKRRELVDDKFLTTYSLTPKGLTEFKRYSDYLKPYLE